MKLSKCRIIFVIRIKMEGTTVANFFDWFDYWKYSVFILIGN